MPFMKLPPRYSIDPQVHTQIDALRGHLFGLRPEDQVALIDNYVGRGKWLDLVFDHFADDILDAMEDESSQDEAEAQQQWL